MTTTFGLCLPAWQHRADGGALLEAVAGQVGIDRLVVPAVTGPLEQFRLGDGIDTPWFATAGGWHFRPDSAAYEDLAHRPVRADWVGREDPLDALRAAAEAAHLTICVRLDLPRAAALLPKSDHLLRRSAWGQPLATACVNHPEVRALATATMRDLRRYAVAGLELADFWPDQHDLAGPTGAAWNPALRGLAEVCFCPACAQIAQRADIDVESARRSVRATADKYWQAPDDPPGEDPLLAAYRAARHADCDRWLTRCRDGLGDALVVRYASAASGPRCTSAAIPLTRQLSAWSAPAAGELPPASGVALPTWRPAFAQSTDLVKAASELVAAGVARIDFEDLEQAPTTALTWLRQAVRKARRE
jgi:hypothetical protein